MPARDYRVAAPSKNYRYFTNVQIAIDAVTRLVIATDDPQPGNRQWMFHSVAEFDADLVGVGEIQVVQDLQCMVPVRVSRRPVAEPFRVTTGCCW